MRLILLVASVGLLVVAGCLAMIYGPASYPDLARLSQVSYFEYLPDGPVYMRLALTPARFAGYRAGLAALLVLGAVATALQLRNPKTLRQAQRLGKEFRRGLKAMGRTVRELSGGQQATAAALLLFLFTAQVLWLITDPLSPDEMVSYDSFVRQGPVAITSFYPIPNNHVFYNILSWMLSLLMPGQVTAAVRLPSLLAATLGCAASYVLLTRLRGFWTATAVTALFGFTRAALLYAASGRGYYLQLGCIQLAFFAVVELATGGRNRRLAWTALLASSVVGLYTVPTFALPLSAFVLVLLAALPGFAPRYRKPYLAQMGLVLLAMAVLSVVLYAPVGCVSGWPRLLGNRYLMPPSSQSFWGKALAYIYETVGVLLGPVRPALLAAALVAALTPLLWWTHDGNNRSRWLGWASLALLITPLALVLIRHTFVPARVLLYTTFFLYLLAVLIAGKIASRWPGKLSGRVLAGLLMALLSFRLLELRNHVPIVMRSRSRADTVARAYQWFRQQPPGGVFVGASYHGLLFNHYANLDRRRLQMSSAFSTGATYHYLIWAKGQATDRPAWAINQPYQVAYEDDMATIYTLHAPTLGKLK